MRVDRSVALALLPAVLLAACGDDPAPAGEVDETRTAAGEVLGGSISDDMLPLGELESQSPPLRQSPAATGGGGGAAPSDAGGDDPAPSDDGGSEPADTAAPEDAAED